MPGPPPSVRCQRDRLQTHVSGAVSRLSLVIWVLPRPRSSRQSTFVQWLLALGRPSGSLGPGLGSRLLLYVLASCMAELCVPGMASVITPLKPEDGGAVTQLCLHNGRPRVLPCHRNPFAGYRMPARPSYRVHQGCSHIPSQNAQRDKHGGLVDHTTAGNGQRVPWFGWEGAPLQF